MRTRVMVGLMFLFLVLVVPQLPAQLSPAWIVPAAAHADGVGGTFWKTDLSIQNPQEHNLQLVIQYLPSGWDNSGGVPTMDMVIYPWETLNFWDVLGPEGFGTYGRGALLVYVPLDQSCPGNSCDFLVSSRTYTVDPWGGGGELAQGIPGSTVLEGLDWSSLSYATGILNDGPAFRCNYGIASWTAEWTRVQIDVQNAYGDIVDSEMVDIPPFGQVQRRLNAPISGGTLVYYLVDGPADSFVYPYASIVDSDTGDPSYFFARYSPVGVTKNVLKRPRRAGPPRGRTVVFRQSGRSTRSVFLENQGS